MENLILSVQCVLPMFLILLTGVFIRRSRVVPPTLFNPMSIMTFKFLMPCLLFYNVYSTDLKKTFQPDLMIFLIGWVLIWFGLSYLFFFTFDKNPKTRGAYIQTAFRSNVAVIGVSLAQSLMSEAGVGSATVAVSILVPLYNILAVVTLETCRRGTLNIRRTLIEIMKNPLIVGCLLGFICLLFHIRLSTPVEETIQKLGNTGSVMMLVALGASIQLKGVLQNLKKVLFCNGIRLILAPLCALTAAILFGFRGEALAVVLICTASPTASAAYPMAIACESDHELTGQSVVTTSLFCCLTLFLWIFILKQLGFL